MLKRRPGLAVSRIAGENTESGLRQQNDLMVLEPARRIEQMLAAGNRQRGIVVVVLPPEQDRTDTACSSECETMKTGTGRYRALVCSAASSSKYLPCPSFELIDKLLPSRRMPLPKLTSLRYLPRLPLTSRQRYPDLE